MPESEILKTLYVKNDPFSEYKTGFLSPLLNENTSSKHIVRINKAYDEQNNPNNLTSTIWTISNSNYRFGKGSLDLPDGTMSWIFGGNREENGSVLITSATGIYEKDLGKIKMTWTIIGFNLYKMEFSISQ